MASTNATAFDDEPLTEAEAERVLSEPFLSAPEPVAPAPAAPKRGRGRPPGSRNKPKAPGTPGPPPRARPRSTSRRSGKAGATLEQKITAAWGIPVAAAAVAGQTLNSDALRADAITLEHYGAAVGKVLAPLAESSPRFLELLDRLSGDAAPWMAAAMLGLSLGSQLAVNHGLISAGAVVSFGAVPREELLGTAAAPEPARQEPDQPAPAAPQAPVDSWAAGSVPPDWQ